MITITEVLRLLPCCWRSKVLFIDLDVHHGDGTASIFADDPSVFTFSLHCHDQVGGVMSVLLPQAPTYSLAFTEHPPHPLYLQIKACDDQQQS